MPPAAMPRAPSAASVGRRIVLALAVMTGACPATAQTSTACATDQLDWYTSVVGESPCRTYERLRQICDGDYKVGFFNSTAPGDSCGVHTQSSLCCCNSIAWNLSMLCMNCQVAGSTVAKPAGIDAGNGAYGRYLASCGVPSNGSLPTNIQAAVCTTQVDIRTTLYDAMWMDSGAWFYRYFQGRMEADFPDENGKDLPNCANNSQSATSATQISETLTPTVISSASSSSIIMPTPEKPDIGAIVGGVAGGVVIVLCTILLLIFWLRRQRVYREYPADSIAPVTPPPYTRGLPPGTVPATTLRPLPPTPVLLGLGQGAGTHDGLSTLVSWTPDVSPGMGLQKCGLAAVPRAKESGWRLSEKLPLGSWEGGATSVGSRRAREKNSGWRLSEKPLSSGAQ